MCHSSGEESVAERVTEPESGGGSCGAPSDEVRDDKLPDELRSSVRTLSISLIRNQCFCVIMQHSANDTALLSPVTCALGYARTVRHARTDGDGTQIAVLSWRDGVCCV